MDFNFSDNIGSNVSNGGKSEKMQKTVDNNKYFTYYWANWLFGVLFSKCLYKT